MGVTPASTDPLVATIFATEAQNYGRGVVQIATPKNLEGAAVGQGNVLTAIEKEVPLEMLPLQFAERAGMEITVNQARSVLNSMNYTLPAKIHGPAGISQALSTTARLTREEIGVFIEKASLMAKDKSSDKVHSNTDKKLIGNSIKAGTNRDASKISGPNKKSRITSISFKNRRAIETLVADVKSLDKKQCIECYKPISKHYEAVKDSMKFAYSNYPGQSVKQATFIHEVMKSTIGSKQTTATLNIAATRSQTRER